MSRRATVPVVLVALTLAACDAKKSEFFEPIPDSLGLSTGDVAGAVTVDGAPLPNVGVRLGAPADLEATTDEGGGFAFEAVEPGTYPVTLTDLPTGVACPEIAVSVIVVAGQVATTSFNCAAFGAVQGSVALNGSAYAGVHVSVAGVVSGQLTSAPDGSFSLTDLPVGTYTLSLESLPAQVVCDSYTEQVIVERAGLASVSFECTDLGAIAGVVLLDGAPYASVHVEMAGAVSADTATDAGGAFAFADVPAGTYAVSLPSLPVGVNCQETSVSLDVVAGQTTGASFDCVSPVPPSFDEIMGDYDVDYVPTLTTCETSIESFTVLGTARPDSSVSPPGVDFVLPHTPHPIWGYYSADSGVFAGDFMWHDEAPGVEWNEFWDVTAFVNGEGLIEFLGTAIVVFRDVVTQAEACRREYTLSGAKRP